MKHENRVVPYAPGHLEALLKVVNAHVAALPPQEGVIDRTALETIVNRPEALWAHHTREHSIDAALVRMVAISDDEVVGLAVAWHEIGGEHAHLPLLVFEPSAPGAAKALLGRIFDELRDRGCTSVATDERNPLGIGWFGVPDSWPHVLETMHQEGFSVADGWVILTGRTDSIPVEPPRPANEMITCVFVNNENMGEWRLEFFHDDKLVGECETWAVPPHLASCPGFHDWITVEWVGVEEAFRRRGLAFWLLVKQMHYHLRAGRTRVALWTGPGNRPARALYYRLGFSDGPETFVLARSLAL